MRLLAVQELRAFAALLVVVHHAFSTIHQYDLGTSALAEFGQFRLFGNAGVDIFFVISGFNHDVQAVATTGPMTWHGFLIKRIKRIVPLYWLLTTVLIGLMLLLPGLFSGSHLDPVHAMASYLLIPYSDSQDIIRPLLVPGWTLTFEMLFYAIFAALLSLRVERIVPALALVFACYIAAVEWLVPENRVLTWLANPVVFEFVFGCFVARLYLQVRSRPAWLPHLLAAAAILLFSGSILFDVGWMGRTLIWGVPAMLLVAAAALPQRLRAG